jgi:hypothetical protein
MTLLEIYYAILDHVESGNIHQGHSMWKPKVFFDIDNFRAVMLRRQLEQGYRINNIVQTVDLTLVPFDAHSVEAQHTIISGLSIPNTAKIFISETALPKRIDVKGRPELQFSGSNLFKSFEFVPPSALEYITYERVTSHLPRVTTIDDYVYVLLTGNDDIRQTDDIVNFQDINPMFEAIADPTTLKVRALFANPMEVGGLTEDDPYPLPHDMSQQLIESLIKKYREQRSLYQDQTNVQKQENLQSQ